MSDHAYIEHTGFKSIGRSESEEIRREKRKKLCAGVQGVDHRRRDGITRGYLGQCNAESGCRSGEIPRRAQGMKNKKKKKKQKLRYERKRD
jgi:hypothetical protein